MALNPQERASVLATYISTKDFTLTAERHNCSPITVRNIHKEFLKSQTENTIDTVTELDMNAVVDVVKESAPELLQSAEHLSKATDSLERLNIASHTAGADIMDKVSQLVATVDNAGDLAILADTVFKVNQAFYSQGMQVNIQQNSVTEGSFASAIGNRFSR